jgi:hypothetical protein
LVDRLADGRSSEINLKKYDVVAVDFHTGSGAAGVTFDDLNLKLNIDTIRVVVNGTRPLIPDTFTRSVRGCVALLPLPREKVLTYKK